MRLTVPCPNCDEDYFRAPMASHIHCPVCETTFHQEWQGRE